MYRIENFPRTLIPSSDKYFSNFLRATGSICEHTFNVKVTKEENNSTGTGQSPRWGKKPAR